MFVIVLLLDDEAVTVCSINFTKLGPVLKLSLKSYVADAAWDLCFSSCRGR